MLYHCIVIYNYHDSAIVIVLIELGLTTHQPLWVILCRLPEKGRTEVEEIEEEMKEDRGERKINDSEETEEIKTFPLYHYLLQG